MFKFSFFVFRSYYFYIRHTLKLRFIQVSS